MRVEWGIIGIVFFLLVLLMLFFIHQKLPMNNEVNEGGVQAIQAPLKESAAPEPVVAPKDEFDEDGAARALERLATEYRTKNSRENHKWFKDG